MSLNSFNHFNDFLLPLKNSLNFFKTLKYNRQNTYAPMNFTYVYTDETTTQIKERYPYPRGLPYAPSQSIGPKGKCNSHLYQHRLDCSWPWYEWNNPVCTLCLLLTNITPVRPIMCCKNNIQRSVLTYAYHKNNI